MAGLWKDDGQAGLCPPGPKLGHVGITHSDVSVSQRIKMENPDSNEQILASIDNAKKLGMVLMFTILQHQQEP